MATEGEMIIYGMSKRDYRLGKAKAKAQSVPSTCRENFHRCPHAVTHGVAEDDMVAQEFEECTLDVVDVNHNLVGEADACPYYRAEVEGILDEMEQMDNRLRWERYDV